MSVLLAENTQGQSLSNTKVTLKAEKASLQKVFDLIEGQTDFTFGYNESIKKSRQVIELNFKDAILLDVLKYISQQANLKFKCVKTTISVVKKPLQPAEGLDVSYENVDETFLQVEGKITDETDGQPLPGVSVLIRGTTTGSISDADGNYSLNAEPEDVLVFSYVGFEKMEIPVNGRSVIDVSLVPDIMSLNEVVVTGYNEIRKESFTGTAVTVSGEDLKQTNPINIFQAIQMYDPSFRVEENNAMGSNPNALPDISIRGTTGLPTGDDGLGESDELDFNRASLTNNPNLPTFILDGFQVDIQTVFDININRVSSITILKDAASAAIYGSRAANGVVVITTKAPKEGSLQVTYNMDVNISSPDLTVYDVLNAEEKLEYERLAGLYETGENGADNGLIDMDAWEKDELYNAKKQNILSGVDTYWLSVPVETSVGSNHSLYVEGGTKTLRYGVTGRYQKINGVMKGSERNRYGGDVNLTYNLKDKLYLSNTLTVNDVRATESPYGSFADYVRMNPYYPKTDENGNIIQVVDEWQHRDNSSGGTGGIIQSQVLNPAYNATLSNFDEERYTQIINSLNTRWVFFQGFELRGLLSFNKKQSNFDRFISPFSNVFYNYIGDDLEKRGQYDYAHRTETSIDGNLTLAYNNVWNGRHIINAAVGGNIRNSSSDYKAFQAVGFTSDRFDNIQFANSYQENASPIGIEQVDRLVGFFGSINYSYNDKYLVDVSARLDGSSKFGSENKFAPFWAAGLGWNLHNEDFLKGNRLINRLKIRGTTGLTGEISFPSYMSNTTYEYKNVWYSTGVGAVNKGYGNEELSWQRTKNYDLGLEASLFNNRIIFNPRMYYRHTKDLLADIIVPPSVGFLSYKANLGEMENRGIEAVLRANVLQLRNGLFVSLYANMAHNQNTITKISESLKKYNDEIDEQQESEGNRGRPLLRYREGQSLNTLYGVRSLGIDPETGREIYLKADGTQTYDYDVRDIVAIGDATPVLEGTFGTNVSYKKLFLSVNFYTRFGGDIYNQTLVDRVENSDPRFNADKRVLAARWKEPSDMVFFKDIADLGTTRTTSRFIQEDNVVELRSVSLSYESYEKLAKMLHMQSIRFMVTMNDIVRWSSVKAERGIDYPFSRSVTLSMQVRF